MTNDEFFAELERLGAAEVRARLASNVYLGGQAALARSWLERRNETSSAEQLALARRASADAHAANKIAIAALAIAIVSIIVTVAGVIVSVIGLHSQP
jgi:hypothetical protein